MTFIKQLEVSDGLKAKPVPPQRMEVVRDHKLHSFWVARISVPAHNCMLMLSVDGELLEFETRQDALDHTKQFIASWQKDIANTAWHAQTGE